MSIIFLVLYITQFGYSEQFEKKRIVIILKTWSMVGNGQACIFNYGGEKDCSHFKTTYKDKMYKNVYLDIPKNFVKKGEIYKVCVNFQQIYSSGKFWNDCIIDQKSKSVEKLFLTLQALDQFDDKKYLGLE
jgi:hypothetical protein